VIFGMEDTHVKYFSVFELRDTRCTGSDTSLTDENGIMSVIFYSFRPIWMKFGI
jgi:hypothetical protein